VNQTQPQCVNQTGKTQSKPLAAWHGRGKAWARHGNGMREVALNRSIKGEGQATNSKHCSHVTDMKSVKMSNGELTKS
jgi:hypothetical protein